MAVDFGARRIRKVGKGGSCTVPGLRRRYEKSSAAAPAPSRTCSVTSRCAPSRLGEGAALPDHDRRAARALAPAAQGCWVTGYRVHDYRHDLATKALRETATSTSCSAARPRRHPAHTTVCYVLDEEVFEGFERVAKRRKNDRNGLGEVV